MGFLARHLMALSCAACVLLSALPVSAEVAPTFTLEDLVRRAKGTNPAMDVARAMLADYRALFDRAYYGRTPTLKLEGVLAPLPERQLLRECVAYDPADPRNLETGEGAGGLGRVFPCPGQNVETDEVITPDTDIGILLRTSARLTFPIYTFGKVRHGQAAARAGIDVGEAGVDIARDDLVFLVKQAYYGTQLTARALKVIKDGRRRMRKAKKDIQVELDKESGRFTSNDLRKLVVQEADLEASFLETMALRETALAGVRLAAELPPGAPFALDTETLEPVHIERRSTEAYVELAVESRPFLRAARAAVRARAAQVSMATADFFPDIALVGLFGYALGTTAPENPDPFANDPYNYLTWGVVLGANWTINYASLVSKHRRAQAALVKQRAQYEALLLKTRLDVVQRAGEVRRRQAEVSVRRTAMKASKGWLVSNSLNFGLGLVSTDQLLKSLVAYSRARLAYYRSIYEHNLAIARLSQLVGTELAVPAPPDE